MEKQEKIVSWIKNHPLFSINGMCKILKTDTSNLMKGIAKNRLPEKFIKQMEDVIGQYGYLDEPSILKVGQDFENEKDEGLAEPPAETKTGNKEVEKKIAEIGAEKPPSYITTPLGKKNWVHEQGKKIKALKNQLT